VSSTRRARADARRQRAAPCRLRTVVFGMLAPAVMRFRETGSAPRSCPRRIAERLLERGARSRGRDPRARGRATTGWTRTLCALGRHPRRRPRGWCVWAPGKRLISRNRTAGYGPFTVKGLSMTGKADSGSSSTLLRLRRGAKRIRENGHALLGVCSLLNITLEAALQSFQLRTRSPARGSWPCLRALQAQHTDHRPVWA
jgi:hypothetical protein